MPPQRLRARTHQARCFWLLYSTLGDGWRHTGDRRNDWLMELKRLALRLNWMYRLGITMPCVRCFPQIDASRLWVLQRGGINTVETVISGVLQLVDSEMPLDERELDMDIMQWDSGDDLQFLIPLLMGTHHRLGRSSPIRFLNDECLQLIAAFSLGG